MTLMVGRRRRRPRQEPVVRDELVTDVAADLPNPSDAYRWAIQRGWSIEQARHWEAYIRRIELRRFLRNAARDGRLTDDTEA